LSSRSFADCYATDLLLTILIDPALLEATDRLAGVT